MNCSTKYYSCSFLILLVSILLFQQSVFASINHKENTSFVAKKNISYVIFSLSDDDNAVFISDLVLENTEAENESTESVIISNVCNIEMPADRKTFRNYALVYRPTINFFPNKLPVYLAYHNLLI